MTAKWPTSEVEVAAPVVAWLRAGGWDVYQEVRLGASCDIVATRGRLIWAVEVKTAFGIAVVEQAKGWVEHAHYVSVAVPHRNARLSAHPQSVLGLALHTWGIGVLGVRPVSYLYAEDADPASPQLVQHVLAPPLHRKVDNRLRAVLCEEQKTYLAAGSPFGSGWSPYKATIQNLRSLVKKHPGLNLREAIKGRAPTLDDPVGIVGIAHHYGTDATAISSLRHWIDAGKVPGVRIKYENKAIPLYPEENDAEKRP